MTTGAAAAAPADHRSNVRRRWLVVVASLVIGMGVAFGLGAAVKKSSTTTTAAGAISPAASISGQGATVTTLSGSAAIPGLKAPPAKPKSTQSSAAVSQSAGNAGAAAQQSVPAQTQPSQVQPQTQVQAPPQTQVQAPPQTHVQAPPQTSTGGVASGGGG